MSDNRNAGFALSYAKDLMANMINQDAETATKMTLQMAEEFLKWLDQPSMEDRIKNCLLKNGLKEINVSRVDVLDTWSSVNGNESEFIKRINERVNPVHIITSNKGTGKG